MTSFAGTVQYLIALSSHWILSVCRLPISVQMSTEWSYSSNFSTHWIVFVLGVPAFHDHAELWLVQIPTYQSFMFSVYRLPMTTQNSDWSKFLLIEVSCSRCTGHAEFRFVQLSYLLKFLCIGVSASLSGDLIPLGSDWSYLLLIEMLVFQVKFEYVMRGGSRVGVLFNMMTAELIWPESVFPTIYS